MDGQLMKGNVCTMGDLTLLSNPEYDREDWETYEVKFALVIEFKTAHDVRQAIKDGKCEFTVFGGE